MDEARKVERARAQEELSSLHETLEAARESKRELHEQFDALTRERDEAVRDRDALKSEVPPPSSRVPF